MVYGSIKLTWNLSIIRCLGFYIIKKKKVFPKSTLCIFFYFSENFDNVTHLY